MASRPRWIPCVRPGAKKFPRLLFSAFDPWPRRAGQIDRRRLLLDAAPAAVSACRRSRLAVAAGDDFFYWIPSLCYFAACGWEKTKTIFL